jgi:hypothetical protein
MSPFPPVAPSDRGAPPTDATMRTLRRLSSRFGFLRVSLVSRVPCGVPGFWVVGGLRDTSPLTTGRFGHPALPSCLTGKYRHGVNRPPRRCPEPVEGFLNQPCLPRPRSQTEPVLSGVEGAGSTTPPPLRTVKCCLPHPCNASALGDSPTFQDAMRCPEPVEGTQPASLLLLCFTVILAASRAEFATDPRSLP